MVSPREIQPGTPLALSISGLPETQHLSPPSFWSATEYDLLHSFQQPLEAHMEDGSLAIPNLQVKDYPLVVRLVRVRPVLLPLVVRN